MVCVADAGLPHLSVYIQVRVMVSGQLLPSDLSLPVTEPLPSQLSVPPRSVIAGTSPMHSTVAASGACANTGALVSLTVMVCVADAGLPHLSVYIQVRVMVSGQLLPSDLSLPVTEPLPSQLSVQP